MRECRSLTEVPFPATLTGKGFGEVWQVWRFVRGDDFRFYTLAIMGEKGNVIGLLCINLYMNTPLGSILNNLTPTYEEGKPPKSFAESFVEDVDELLKLSLKEASDKVYNDRNIATSNKNKEIITILNEKGIF